MKNVWRVKYFLCAALVSCLAVLASASEPFEFFAFDNGLGRGDLAPDEQAAILSDLGYSGIGYTGTENIPAMLEALKKRGLKMVSTYVGIHVAPGQPAYDPGLPAAIQQLKGQGTMLWVYVQGGPASSADMDDRAVQVLREIAKMADDAGLRVALYPHTGFYVAMLEDAVRLAKKVDRKNVGVSFNLCHFLKTDRGQNLFELLQAAMPHMFLVSINGADSGKTFDMDWDRLIQPLGQGSFEVLGYLKVLKAAGYKGPVGLQCYGIQREPRDHLAQSMAAWRKMMAAMAAE